ncbi:hypothetical protein PG987_012196, partial [Apiospora arundinis]
GETMPLICCCCGPNVSLSSPRASTPEAALPARPAPARLSDAPYPGSSTKAKIVAAKPPDAPSRIRTPMKQPVVDLSNLEVEDSDDGNEGGLGSANHSSSSTLEALKAKFIRRLSQLSESSSGSKRTHTPCSEGELARRAELRRLRQKRIEEELKNEQEAEGKTKSGDDRAPSEQHARELSGGGPRDAIEYNLAETEELKPDCTSPSDTHERPENTRDVVKLVERRRSISDVGSHERLSSTEDKSLREYKSLPEMPSSPRLHPAYLPSIYSSNSIVSWRLSYSDGNFIGSLKQSMDSTSNLAAKEPIEEKECESSTAVTPKPLGRKRVSPRDSDTETGKALASGTNQQGTDDGNDMASSVTGTVAASLDLGKRGSAQTTIGRSSPLDMWLHIQGLGLSRYSSSDPGSCTTGPGDGIKPGAPPSDTQHDQPSEKSSWHTRELPVGFGPSTSGTLKQEIRGVINSSSEEDLGIYIQQRKSTSSHYTTQSSNPRSPPPLPLTTTPNSVMYRGIYITHPTPDIPASSSRTTNNDGSDTSSYKTAPIEPAKLVPVTEINIASLRRPTDETMSSMLSETESFKQREAELLSVAKRFPRAAAGLHQGANTASKFREEFDLPKKSKPAILAKLQFPRTKTAIDASQTAAAGPNATSVSPNAAKQAPGPRNHGIPESATNVWQRAVRLEADRRELLRKDRESSHGHSKSGVFHEERPISTPVDVPPNRQTEIKTVSSSSEVCLPLRSSMPPKTWARWPSHTRTARNGPAQQHDSIRPKDFAVAKSPIGEAKWSTDNSPAALTEPMERSESLSGKVTKAIRKSIAKMMPGGDGNVGPKPRLVVDTAQRGRPGYLEYPELELLPMAGGYKELEALERQIEHIKNPSETRSPPAASPNRSPRIPLGQRFADEVHMFQHGDRADSPDTNDHLTTLPPPRKSTPARMQQPTPHVVSEVTTHYATPKSHMSYEDCVPKHMLDDNGSSQSDDSANVKRSLSNVEHRMPGQAKYSTWNGRIAKKVTEPVLRKSTHEFGVELEELLVRERDRALDVGVKRDDAEIPGRKQAAHDLSLGETQQQATGSDIIRSSVYALW